MFVRFVTYLAIAMSPGIAEGHPLAVRCTVANADVLHKIPLIVTIEIRNDGTQEIKTIFPKGDPEVLADRSSLVLTDERGRTYLVNYRGGALVERNAPVAICPLLSGEVRAVDRLFSLVTPEVNSGQYNFLPPGKYTARVQVALLHGLKLTSDPFQVRILEPRGVDAKACDGITFSHVGFFEGRDAPVDPASYRSSGWWKKVDVSRFQDIQKILDDFPDSEYAEWIRFWKVYHHGSEGEALAYARAHQDFPLCDNLMFRVAQHVANDDARHNEALALLAELQRIFPGGDTDYRAKTLQEKLVNRKRRP